MCGGVLNVILSSVWVWMMGVWAKSAGLMTQIFFIHDYSVNGTPVDKKAQLYRIAAFMLEETQLTPVQ